MSVVPAPSENPISITNVEDFRRLGLRTGEFRLAVIRRAVTQHGASWAEVHGDQDANREAELQIVQVATSGYRLMDPRRRTDGQERAILGRIQPGALRSASPVAFCSDAADIGLGDFEAAAEVTDSSFELNADNDPRQSLSDSDARPGVKNRIAEYVRNHWPITSIASLAPSKLSQVANASQRSSES